MREKWRAAVVKMVRNTRRGYRRALRGDMVVYLQVFTNVQSPTRKTCQFSHWRSWLALGTTFLLEPCL